MKIIEASMNKVFHRWREVGVLWCNDEAGYLCFNRILTCFHQRYSQYGYGQDGVSSLATKSYRPSARWGWCDFWQWISSDRGGAWDVWFPQRWAGFVLHEVAFVSTGGSRAVWSSVCGTFFTSIWKWRNNKMERSHDSSVARTCNIPTLFHGIFPGHCWRV